MDGRRKFYQDLLNATGSGELDDRHAGLLRMFLSEDRADLFMKAFQGSLDAAEALFNDLLPKCMWQRQAGGQFDIFDSSASLVGHGSSKITSRAWLIAIFRAWPQVTGECYDYL